MRAISNISGHWGISCRDLFFPPNLFPGIPRFNDDLDDPIGWGETREGVSDISLDVRTAGKKKNENRENIFYCFCNPPSHKVPKRKKMSPHLKSSSSFDFIFSVTMS